MVTTQKEKIERKFAKRASLNLRVRLPRGNANGSGHGNLGYGEEKKREARLILFLSNVAL